MMPPELATKHETLCTGYLAGTLDLKSALSQLQSVTEQVVDQTIARSGLRI
jgi:hypothetical protein